MKLFKGPQYVGYPGHGPPQGPPDGPPHVGPHGMPGPHHPQQGYPPQNHQGTFGHLFFLHYLQLLANL